MVNVPPSYDLEALKRDLARVEEEIKIFFEKVEELKQRKLELLQIIQIVEKREALKKEQEELERLIENANKL